MKKLKLNKSKTKGFTLIELIIVMAIVLIMSSFLIPKFNGYRQKAERMKAIDTGRQIYLSAMESYMENNGVFDKDKLQKTSKELLGIDNLKIESALEDNVVIKYDVDNKEYSLNFGKNTNNFCINYKEKQIYPKDNSVNVTKLENQEKKLETKASEDEANEHSAS